MTVTVREREKKEGRQSSRAKERTQIITCMRNENALVMFMFEFVDDFDPFNVKKTKIRLFGFLK